MVRISCASIFVLLVIHNLILVNSNHTNNWAVLVATSTFWFNYRHISNVLSIYEQVKRLGIPDSQIILMIADDIACNPRNPMPATVFNKAEKERSVYGDDVEVDYRSYEVTPENLVRILTGRHTAYTPRSKKLLSDEGSNILIYLSGHGGNGYIKFQDYSELTSEEIADTVEQMWQKRRYNEILIIFDTCEAESLYKKLYSPNVVSFASSLIGENSLSHENDQTIGVPIIDKYSYYLSEFLESIEQNSTISMSELLNVCPKDLCISTPNVRDDLLMRDILTIQITDFFGSIRPIAVIHKSSVMLQPLEV